MTSTRRSVAHEFGLHHRRQVADVAVGEKREREAGKVVVPISDRTTWVLSSLNGEIRARTLYRNFQYPC
jgi:hypothetical protein